MQYMLPHFSHKIYSMPIKRIPLINKHVLEWKKKKLNLHLPASNIWKFQHSKQIKFLSLVEEMCICIVFWKSTFLQLNFEHKLDNWYNVHKAQTYTLLYTHILKSLSFLDPLNPVRKVVVKCTQL